MEGGKATTVQFTTQNERARRDTVALVLTAPPRVELEPEAPPPGWSVAIVGDGLRWSGGRIEGSSFVSFPARVTARVAPGAYAFRAVQRYEDGRLVRWEAAFTVLPGAEGASPDQHLGRAIAAGVLGLLVVGGSLLGVHLLRRRRIA